MTEARAPLEPGRIVIADEQTEGIGRHGRQWHSPSGQGLYVSIVLALEPAPLVTLSLGLAVREAIDAVTGLDADLRWPNDILIGGRKCSGILAQVESRAVIAGIGINVAQTEFPDGLETPATSLLLEGVLAKREDILVALIHAVERNGALTRHQVLDAFARASSYVSGKRVRVADSGRAVEGVTCGLDPAGFLRLREDNGTEMTILAGGVRPV
jgi:BirA family biotin operon repressor/biotin-[acetyl-CoA-carboxylase] ligase